MLVCLLLEQQRPPSLSRHPRSRFAAIMPLVHVTWLPKTCRTAAARKEVADAIIKAMIGCKSADIHPNNMCVRCLPCYHDAYSCITMPTPCPTCRVVRFSESVGGFPLPKGYSLNPELQAEDKGP